MMLAVLNWSKYLQLNSQSGKFLPNFSQVFWHSFQLNCNLLSSCEGEVKNFEGVQKFKSQVKLNVFYTKWNEDVWEKSKFWRIEGNK